MEIEGRPNPDELKLCTQILEKVLDDRTVLGALSREDRMAFMIAAGKISRPDRLELMKLSKVYRRLDKKKKNKSDRGLRAKAEIRVAREAATFVAPKKIESGSQEERHLEIPRNCYVCKVEYKKLHFFYDSMCEKCGDLNYSKRFQTAPLHGRVALITGARLKIGYQASLMMLRAGARVIVTTRFPNDAALRYSREEDFQEWSERLQIHGLDLRHSPSVELFTRYLNQNCDRLDILINNAAQTVRRPPGFYAHLMDLETKSFGDLPSEVRPILSAHYECKGVLSNRLLSKSGEPAVKWLSDWHQSHLGLQMSAALSQIPYDYDDRSHKELEVFPVGKMDADLQQVDLRSKNSWRMTLAEVPTPEMLEVQLVNSVAPFILCSKLKPLMLLHPTGEKHIVNVSAMEGKFARFTKTDKHPHTNMAKAALNMMTLTSAPDYARDGIHMNAVDTGWVTDEDPHHLSQRKREEHDFQPPLDIVDGAARVCDPFFSGLLTGNHVWGKFLKDYFSTTW
jgi:NAD(P)-dependent dehydrogenase (short-subunit alcohol dehydrogenase family)